MQPRPQLSARAEGAWMKACKHRTKIGDVDDGSKPCPALHKRVGKVQSEGNGGEETQPLYQRGPERRAGKLGCDVDGPSIMAAAAVFRRWELNLETEGSLLLSRAGPLLCILLQSAALMHSESMQPGCVASQHKWKGHTTNDVFLKN